MSQEKPKLLTFETVVPLEGAAPVFASRFEEAQKRKRRVKQQREKVLADLAPVRDELTGIQGQIDALTSGEETGKVAFLTRKGLQALQSQAHVLDMRTRRMQGEARWLDQQHKGPQQELLKEADTKLTHVARMGKLADSKRGGQAPQAFHPHAILWETLRGLVNLP